jgi:hypothetical protein
LDNGKEPSRDFIAVAGAEDGHRALHVVGIKDKRV